MLPILQIGPLALPAPAFLLLLGFWIGLELMEKQAHLFGAEARQMYNMTLVAILAGLVGARLVYAASAPAIFMRNPLDLLAPRPQMLNTTGGVVFGLLAAAVYGWRRRLPLRPALDAATTLFSVLAVALGLAHFASGEAFGAPARLPWSIELWGELRHPAQVYETLAAMLAAALVWPGAAWAGSRIGWYTRAHPGFRFWVFLALCAVGRLILETFRGDSILMWNTFRQAQLIAWLVLAVSLWQIGHRLEMPQAASEAVPGEEGVP